VQTSSNQAVVAVTPARLVTENGAGATVTMRQSTLVVLGGAQAPSVLVSNAAQRVLATGGQQGVQGVPGPQGTPGAAGGTYETRTASETLGGHRIVRSTGADTVGYASSDNPDHGDDTQGMTLGAATSGATVNVQRVGSVTHSGWAWTPGEPVFLGTSGLPTQTPPSDGFVQVIGHAEAADTLFLSIEPPIYF
jgi:hypothetical protein